MQLEIPEGCGVGQRCWKSPQSSVKSLVCGLLGRGGGSAGGVGISSGVGGHEDPFHHIRMEVF